MTQDMKLKQLVEQVVDFQRKNDHPESYIIYLKQVFGRLLRLASETGEEYLTDALIEAFMADDKNFLTGKYCHRRFLENHRAVSFLQSYMDTGKVIVKRYSSRKELQLPEEFSNALMIYDRAEEDSGLSTSSLTKNRRPIRYLLEYMSNLGYTRLSDIQPGDTLKAIQYILDEHYTVSSLCTAISGMRRFYRMFPELYPYRNEIPNRLLRNRPIIDAYTEEEQERIKSVLFSRDITRRNAAIGILCFESGLRDVDICNLKLADVDWKHNIIYIIQSKTKRPLNLPLRSSYGNAMLEYLINERPQSDNEHFFLKAVAPFEKLRSIGSIISDIVDMAGIETKGRSSGPRMFRHNAASTMVRKGVPLPAISESLGHGSLDSTMVYISNDKEVMASLTLPLPKAGGHK